MNRNDIRPGTVVADGQGDAWVVLSIGADDVLLHEADAEGDPTDDGGQQLVSVDDLDMFRVRSY